MYNIKKKRKNEKVFIFYGFGIRCYMHAKSSKCG